MAEKKRLHHFLTDMLKLSCVKGFKHFATHMRGREEMVCSIVNEPSVPIIQSATNSPAVSFGHRQKREAFPMSQKQQRRLSGYGFINVGLPPASPSENEEVDESQTMFLIAGYSRYNRPYVWVRTNHDRLVRLASEEEKDYPLMLQTTSQWQEKDVKVWDVLTELVEVCASPSPTNPFAVDLNFFLSLTLQERVLASAAMISFLQRVIASGHHHYNRKIVSDIGKVGQIHFTAVQRLVQEDPPPLPSSSSSQTPQSVAATRHTAGERSQSVTGHTPREKSQALGGHLAMKGQPPAGHTAGEYTQGATGHTVIKSQAAVGYTARENTRGSAGDTTAEKSQVPSSTKPATNLIPSVPIGSKTSPEMTSAFPPQSSYPRVPHTLSGVPQPRPGVTPPQAGAGVSYTPNPYPLPQPHQPPAQPPPTSSSGQFYSRRMAGSYNY